MTASEPATDNRRRRGRWLAWAILGFGVLAFGAGEQPARDARASSERVADPVGDAPARDQWYRLVLRAPGEVGEVPLFLMLPGASDGAHAVFASGAQRVRGHYERQFDQITVSFPLYHTRLSLAPDPAADASGALVGTWATDSPSLGRASIAARAAPIDAPDEARRFDASVASEPPTVDATGSWIVQMESDRAELALTQTSTGAVTGMISLANGSDIYLAGVAAGDRLRLSAFDGTSAYLLDARVGADGAMRGRWAAGACLGWVDDVRAVRAEGPAGPRDVRLADEDSRLTLPEEIAARYAGAPVIVQIAATWCAACSHVAPVLKDIYQRHRGDGLAVVTLTYELTDDPAYDDQQAALYKREHDLPWEVVAVHGTLDEFADDLPVALVGSEILTLPLTIFANADGSVVDFMAGFPAPEVPDERERAIRRYRELAAELVAR